MAPIRRLLWRNVAQPGGWFHLARKVMVASADNSTPHTHDFAEVFWLEDGTGTHCINGRRLALGRGDIVFIRPPDQHGYRLGAAKTFTLVNLAFSAATLDFVHRRYFTGRRDWPWAPNALPAMLTLNPSQLSQLAHMVDDLAQAPQHRIEVESFLLNLLRLVIGRERQAQAVQPPAWLRMALDRFAQPRHLTMGTVELARLTGRSPEHVSRVVRKLWKQTPTELVNRIRTDHAARELRMTDRSIVQIANDCGLGNLGHFYKLFKHRFAMTPRQYRLRHQAVVR